MTDEIIQELRQVKDAIAAEHGYDVRRLVERLRIAEKSSDSRVVDLRAQRMRGSDPATLDPVGNDRKHYQPA
uniref:Uncharacterized protein n=1 Tax=Candidatus Kentrum sp. MB TaxID=2138164 RepID=A0A450X4C9_9GAMM|nr:MAG: hypothetical protein BECKMB1821G_GA0114241_100750 [Candidatus Kentron sp. MB]VFK30555.1 MAG: hypothetical protein BECKMB1821I_GA0114274_101632 [Candidatus Kentron sp. MB]VFK75299.1 MAG: hypothetical protein BECKMB1821H_GA0114242_101931 [Candidatus Kentron sp. MB]